jgi:glycosyltransferase involved in cell wall biosynthesis
VVLYPPRPLGERDGSGAPKVSVIVPARNAAGRIEGLLAALSRQTASEAYEVVVVDDGSQDATAELVRRSGTARLISIAAPAGVYDARNRGIEASRAEVLAFTDADCVPAPDWIERGLAALERSHADVLAGRFEAPLGERPTAAEILDLTHNYDQERYAAEGHGAAGNLWIRREVVERVGGFDPALRSGGDTEFGQRATAAGFRLVYAPEVVVRHELIGSLPLLARRYFRLGVGRAQRRAPDLRARIARGGAYVSRRYMRDRLHSHGYDLSAPRAWWIGVVVKNLFVRVPLAAGNAAGAASARLRAGLRM